MQIGEIKFANVTSISGNKVKVKFSTNVPEVNCYFSKYKHVSVAIGDRVAMKWTGNTYICEGVVE